MEGVVKKSFALIAAVLMTGAALPTGPAGAQQPSQAQAAAPTQTQAQANCVSQYVEVPGRTPAGLVASGFAIKGAVTGGLWMQKEQEVFYCNSSGRLQANQPVCWQLREPAAGGLC
jgi:hypothetical protein